MSTAVEISVNIDVPDLEAAIEFYRLALGLHLGRRLFEGSVAEMLGASSKIYLLMKPAGDSDHPSLDCRATTTVTGLQYTSTLSSTMFRLPLSARWRAARSWRVISNHLPGVGSQC